MKKWFWIIGAIIVIAIPTSFLFVDYTISQGYVIAGLILLLSIINFVVMTQTRDSFPSLKFKVGKSKWKIENHRLLMIGMLLILIGLTRLILGVKSPLEYVILSSGLYFTSFSRVREEKN